MEPQPPFRVENKDAAFGDECFDTAEHLAAALEFFDSDTDDTQCRVWDAQGRPLRVKVWATEIKLLEVYDEPPSYYTDPEWHTSRSSGGRGGCAGTGCAIGALLLLLLLQVVRKA